MTMNMSLSHELNKNWQGGIHSTKILKEKLMNVMSRAGETCPLKTLKLFLTKTNYNKEFQLNLRSIPENSIYLV